MKILIVRHADPDYSVDSLTKKGWREAEYLAERLGRYTGIPVDPDLVQAEQKIRHL